MSRLASNFLNQDFGSEDEDDDFDPGADEESDAEHERDDDHRLDQDVERNNVKKQANANGPGRPGEVDEVGQRVADHDRDEDEEDEDEEDDEDDEDDEDAVSVSRTSKDVSKA
jgi:transcription elongation factor SPT5